jgi:uncharacterized protein (DUF885 family)
MKKTAAFCLLLLLAVGSAATADEGYETKRASILERVEKLRASSEGPGEVDATQVMSASERLQAFIDLYFEYAMNEFPTFATFIGIPGDHHRWGDNSLEAMAKREQDEILALEIFQSIPRDDLEGVDRLNYDLLMEQLVDAVKGHKFHGEYLAITQMGGVQQNIARTLTMMPARNSGDYENLLGRLGGTAQQVEDTLTRLEVGLEKGVTPPQVTLRDVPQQVKNQIVEDPLTSPLLRAFTQFPEDMPAEEQERLRNEAVEIYTSQIVPAYQKLHDYLENTYIPGARESIGMSDLPDGQEWYAYNANQSTTTDLTPKQIHEIGLSEVARIRGEMEAIIEEVGFEGDLAAFFDFLRTDDQFYFEDKEDLLATYRDISKRADNELVKLFGHLPRLPYGVVPVPEYAEKSQTTAYYEPGSLAAGRSGKFFANTYDLKSRPKWEMEALTLHEAVPGHHLQIAIQQELDELPWFRRFGGYTAFVEGWGLYSESLGEEMGFYEDPYSKFGQLTYEMWRAIRLVVDTGMHSLGWTREQAIDFFKENAGKAEHDIVVEVDRYIVWPGQALAYKIGELKIKELRAMAEAELGDNFNVRAFHDTVLGSGAVPLRVLETNMREWVESERVAAAGGDGESDTPGS